MVSILDGKRKLADKTLILTISFSTPMVFIGQYPLKGLSHEMAFRDIEDAKKDIKKTISAYTESIVSIFKAFNKKKLFIS
jgi:hypothetical protein